MRRTAIALLASALALASFPASARVVRVEIATRADVADGKPFGDVGPYEKVVGRVFFAVDPAARQNRRIVDLDKAPRNAAGEVEFSADLFLLKPKDMARANGALLLEISNRGGKAILSIVNGGRGAADPTAEADLGDGFLMRRGFVVAWLGWQFDVHGEGVRLHAPVARDADGSAIQGLVRSDFNPDVAMDEMPLGHWIAGRIGGDEYPVADRRDRRNVLTVRDRPEAPRQVIPRDRWDFAHRGADGGVAPSDRFVRLRSGAFEAGRIYELVYVAKDPVVQGLGLAGVRDFASWVKHDDAAVAHVARAYSVGISQSGRFLRHFLYEGFNEDERGRKVLDGVVAHVAGAGRGSFNHRFAQPSRDAQPMSAIFYPTDLFPFSDARTTDPMTHSHGALLDGTPAALRPKLFLTNTSYEYWSRGASLTHTTLAAKPYDLEPTADVRIYLLAGLQHFTGSFPPRRDDCGARPRHPTNPNPVRWFWRAVLVALDGWVKDGTAPPPSAFPRIADGTLVATAALRFPAIPGAQPPAAYDPFVLDFGPRFARSGVVERQPPVVKGTWRVLVPQVDEAGNDLGGVRPPELEAPLATYTGWNYRAPEIGAPWARISFLGSYLALPRTAEDRRASGDPRRSIEERWPTREAYLEAYAAAARALVARRLLLEEDLPAVLERAQLEWEFATSPRS
ncbi:MAG TPA: alpha/beta hydrolase domain-containing protein [Anaeromyxobacter sp.]|nr:alpha/beta hydrolase domain-containing protein [Anaeromyxobacter sp.]